LKLFEKMAHPTGFEPVASAFGGQQTLIYIDDAQRIITNTIPLNASISIIYV